MRNMFDDFMEELRRRQAEKEAADGQHHGGSDDTADGDAPSEGPGKDETMRSVGPDSDDTDRDDGPARPSFGRGGFRGGYGRYSGGPSDELPEIHIGRGWIIFGVIVAVQNQPTGGARFTISLPLDRHDSVPAE